MRILKFSEKDILNKILRTTKMKILVLVAMDKEYKQLLSLKNDNIIVEKTGIGKVNAAVNAVRAILKYNPDLVISSGCAGGASTNLDVMDVVVSSRIVYHDVYCNLAGESYGQIQGMPLYYESPEELVKLAESLDYSQHIHAGLIASGDWFVDSLDKINEIKSHFPDAIAIDMESAALAQTCFIMGVPFINFRVISDVPAKGHNLLAYNNFWDTVSENSFSITQQFIVKLLNN